MKRRSLRARTNRLLVDTNVLLLFIVGSLSLDRIAKHKRTDSFSPEDYQILVNLLRKFRGIVVTPSVLAEVSNLLGQTDDQTRIALLALLGDLVRTSDERYVPSVEVVETVEFLRLGLTDAGILALTGEDLTVLTDDIHLYLALQRRGVEAINFHHVRESAWR